MAYENLIFEVRNQIAYITFNRPKVLNALNRRTVEELGDALLRARDDSEVRVLILTGAGEKSFVAGADINELALSCSMRIASKNAKLGQPEVKLGIIPGYGGSQRLARLCGKGIAHELILSGEMISADEALRVGLVNRVVEQAELIPTAESIAKKIAANAPLAVKFAMEAVEHGMEMPQEEGLFLEATLFGLCCATEDMREGTRAFIEKRPAQFKGK